jgi:hypothetical protein
VIQDSTAPAHVEVAIKAARRRWSTRFRESVRDFERLVGDAEDDTQPTPCPCGFYDHEGCH